MNYEHLKTFITVAEKKNFSETARLLHLSQPTVTSHIKSLEQQLETSLFDRNTKQVNLTAAAKILYRYAKDIVKLSDNAINDISSISNTVNGRLEIACSLTIGDNILPQILGEFKKVYPHIQFSANITNTHQILSQIKDHVLDIGLIEASVDDPDLILEPFMEDELVLIASPSYFDNDKGDIPIKTVSELPFILREQGSGTRRVMEEHLNRSGIPPSDLNVILELGSTESIKAAVESGLGVSIISKTSVKKELALHLLNTYSIEDIKLTRQFYSVYHRDTVLKLTSKVFLQLIKDLASSNYFSKEFP